PVRRGVTLDRIVEGAGVEVCAALWLDVARRSILGHAGDQRRGDQGEKDHEYSVHSVSPSSVGLRRGVAPSANSQVVGISLRTTRHDEVRALWPGGLCGASRGRLSSSALGTCVEQAQSVRGRAGTAAAARATLCCSAALTAA